MSEEKKKRLKEYQKKLSRGEKTYFTNADMSIKVHYKIAIAKIFFVCSFINFQKIRWCFNNNNNKSLECMAPFWPYIRFLLYY